MLSSKLTTHLVSKGNLLVQTGHTRTSHSKSVGRGKSGLPPSYSDMQISLLEVALVMPPGSLQQRNQIHATYHEQIFTSEYGSFLHPNGPCGFITGQTKDSHLERHATVACRRHCRLKRENSMRESQWRGGRINSMMLGCVL